MEFTLAETIREITRNHLENNNGLLLGQSITAVGWVNGTVPDTKNIIELPMCDVAGAGIAVGCGIAQRRPIFVIRYQDFIELGLSPIVNYAAKSKEIFGTGVPMWIRLIADEGHGLGPVHSGKLHSMFMHFPGLKVVAPVTPSEYNLCWDMFMRDDAPYIVSEHRASYKNKNDIQEICYFSDNADITIYAISVARMNAAKAIKILAKEGIKCNFTNIYLLKPLIFMKYFQPKYGLVLDTGFESCGISQSIAYQIMVSSKQKVFAMGLGDYSIGCTKETENLTPSVEQIVRKVKEILNR